MDAWAYLRNLDASEFIQLVESVIDDCPDVEERLLSRLHQRRQKPVSGLLGGIALSQANKLHTCMSSGGRSLLPFDAHLGANLSSIHPITCEVSHAHRCSEDAKHPALIKIHHHILRILLGSSYLSMAIALASSYVLSIRSHRVNRDDFFISSSIDVGWAHRWGAFGMSVGFTMFFLAMLTRFFAVAAACKALPVHVSLLLWRYNTVALISAVCGCLGAMGVAAFNVGFNRVVHFSFAFTLFGGSLASCFAHSRIDAVLLRNAVGPSRVLVYLRHVLCFGGVLGLFGMVSCLLAGGSTEAALSEFIMCACVFTYFLTWLVPDSAFAVNFCVLVAHTEPS